LLYFLRRSLQAQMKETWEPIDWTKHNNSTTPLPPPPPKTVRSAEQFHASILYIVWFIKNLLICLWTFWCCLPKFCPMFGQRKIPSQIIGTRIPTEAELGPGQPGPWPRMWKFFPFYVCKFTIWPGSSQLAPPFFTFSNMIWPMKSIGPRNPTSSTQKKTSLAASLCR
jgi:hypothetical protein